MTERKPEIEAELAKLGWASKEYGVHEIHVYQEYRKKREMWEFTVYGKLPIWKWDFVIPMPIYRRNGEELEVDHMAWGEHHYRPGQWIWNIRWDYETKTVGTPAEIAKAINDDFEAELDGPYPLREYHVFGYAPVQRVLDRPKK